MLKLDLSARLLGCDGGLRSWSVLQHRVRSSLLAAEIAGAATLVRSIAYDRWWTVLVSVLLIAGALAAQRGRTWGVALAFASAMAFPVAWAIGIAPAWFCLVGIAGALPFVHLLPAFARFDRRATAFLAGLAATLGALGAVVWKNVALSVFVHVPLLRPSLEANHGLFIAALVGAGFFAARARIAGARNDARVRIGERVRVADPASFGSTELADATIEEEAEPPARRARLP